jgi:hypothetical protein
MSTGRTRRNWKDRMVRGITIGATSIALLTAGQALGSSPSQASAAIASTPLVVGDAGVEPTLEADVIIEESDKPSMTIDPIESSGVVLVTTL